MINFEDIRFYNTSEKNLSFEEVFSRIKSFVEAEPKCSYTLSIGTDCQAFHKETRFVTGIIIHRKDPNGIGKGAWGCLKKTIIERKITSVREKISTEIAYSQEIAILFTPEKLSELHTDNLSFEIHIDIGEKGLTKDLIKDMTNRIQSMGITPKIKPDSYTASTYADRFTK